MVLRFSWRTRSNSILQHSVLDTHRRTGSRPHDRNFTPAPATHNVIGSPEFTVIWKLGTIMIILARQIKAVRFAEERRAGTNPPAHFVRRA